MSVLDKKAIVQFVTSPEAQSIAAEFKGQDITPTPASGSIADKLGNVIFEGVEDLNHSKSAPAPNISKDKMGNLIVEE